MLWVKNVGGKLETNVRYSSKLCYNTFPINQLEENKIKQLEDTSFKIIEEREKYSEKNIANLYGDKMPLGLKKVHEINDNLVDEIIFGKKTLNNSEKISYLFSKYEICVNNEKKELF